MALIDTSHALTPAQQAARLIRAESAQMHMILLSAHQSIYRALWEAESPQSVLDELGEDAASLFVGGSKIIDLLLSQNPTCLIPDQYVPQQAPTINPDGTVTLTP